MWTQLFNIWRQKYAGYLAMEIACQRWRRQDLVLGATNVTGCLHEAFVNIESLLDFV